jgi:hypothetical protein
MAPPREILPAVSWTYRRGSEEWQEHEFANLLQELVCAVQRDDETLTRYCLCELRRAYRKRRP